MSFFGKKFKKVDSVNMAHIIEKLEVPPEILARFSEDGPITTFQKNSDGSILITLEKDGEKILERKLELNKEQEITTPTGVVLKQKFVLNGEQLKGTVTSADGRILHMDRTFDGNKSKMVVQIDGDDHKGEIHFETINLTFI